ncbi:hypothetical protein CapIbe_015998 [Capra ibex]
MTALSARGHLTLGAVVIRRGEAGGARQQGWAQAESRRRERGPGTRARAPAFPCRQQRPLACLPPPDTVLFSPLSPSALLPRRPSEFLGNINDYHPELTWGEEKIGSHGLSLQTSSSSGNLRPRLHIQPGTGHWLTATLGASGSLQKGCSSKAQGPSPEGHRMLLGARDQMSSQGAS